MEDLFMLCIQIYRLWGDHGLVLISAPLCCVVPLLRLDLPALQLSAFQGFCLPLLLSYLATCKSDLGIFPALGSIGMLFLREVCAFPVQVPGLNWLSTSAAAAPHIKFSVLQLYGSLWKMSLCSGERLQGKTESHALVSLRIPYTDLETGDVFQIMPFYTIFSFFIFRTFAILWRVLNYCCYEIYLGYLEKKS